MSDDYSDLFDAYKKLETDIARVTAERDTAQAWVKHHNKAGRVVETENARLREKLKDLDEASARLVRTNERLREEVAAYREAGERRANLTAALGFEKKPGADHRGGASDD